MQEYRVKFRRNVNKKADDNTVGENIIASIKMRNNLCYPLKKVNLPNIAIAKLNFSLLLPI